MPPISIQINWLLGLTGFRWEVYVREQGQPGSVTFKTRSPRKLIEKINNYASRGFPVRHHLCSPAR